MTILRVLTAEASAELIFPSPSVSIPALIRNFLKLLSGIAIGSDVCFLHCVNTRKTGRSVKI